MLRPLSLFFILFYLTAGQAAAQLNARMIQQPDVSETQIVFGYAGDIWIVNKKGGTAHRLSNADGQENFPRFSPDGSMVAYNANYDGNTDIYVLPSRGGVPKRLTHHPMGDRVLDWYPDGSSILYATRRESGRQRYSQFYKLSKNGGMPDKLPVPYGEFGAISPDGKFIAYTPKTRVFRNWKRYRGGWAPDIILFNLETLSSENITNHDANDDLPMWHGSTLYFISDRGPELRYNIWAYETENGNIRQVTNFAEYDVHFPAIGPSDMVFENAGKLYLMDLETEQYRQIEVDVVTDAISIKQHAEQVENLIQNTYLSPSGKRVLFQARGDIFSVPKKNGPVKNLTRSSGIAERFPSWSPDGKKIAYWSDRSGEYELVVRDNGGDGKEQTLTSTGEKFKYAHYWSPDSRKLVFIDNAMRIRLYDIDKKALETIDQALWLYHGGLFQFSVSWSADSRWIAFSRGLDTQKNAIFLYDSKNKALHQATSGFYNDRDPSFDPDGKYLYFKSSRTLDPIYSNLDNTWIYANTTNIVAVPLRNEITSPTAPRNDTEKDKQEEDREKKNEKDQKTDPVEIDIDRFEQRLVKLPVEAGNFGALDAASGKVIYQRNTRTGATGRGGTLAYYDLEEREEKTVIEKTFGFQLSADRSKALVNSGGKYHIIDLAPDQEFGESLRTGELELTVDPRSEWQQLFNDAWRLVRDYFYDPNFHGLDWSAKRKQYQQMLEDAVTRSDVNYVIGEMIAELNASHTYRGGGDTENADRRRVGVLGINWKLENGAYRIDKIVRGAPWDSEIRSPLDQPGLNIGEGDYILAVNGVPMDPSKDPWAAFQGLAEKTVQLTVNDKPSMDGAKTVLIETLASDTRLRHLAWINSNRSRVEEASGGKIGYIYVPNTGTQGQTELVRQFTAQFNKEGLIIDERFNSGGQIPDRFVELLNRPELAYWAVRDGRDWQWSPVAHFGHKAMLINGWSGSGGDAFPDYFKQLELGPLVGTRTWGGLIGITGAPTLIDGGGITVPTFRMYYPNGKWFPEGYGVEPDIKVADNPTQLAKGTDPQLEKAIDVLMQQIEANPVVKPKRPPYETRTGTGMGN
ncbi:MAG: PDZ domain-containing protein [Balneolaceae bacterium]|nr:PDZ domain-containing protein [Balneolaceae bacterium]